MTTLTFTNEQLAIIDEALSAMPFRRVANLIAEINNQLANENNSKNSEVLPEAK